MEKYTSVQKFLEELGIDKETYKTIYETKKKHEEKKKEVNEMILGVPGQSKERIYKSLYEFLNETGLEAKAE